MNDQLILDIDIVKAFIEKAIDNNSHKIVLNWTIDSGRFIIPNNELNDVFRICLGINSKKSDLNDNYPSSRVIEIQQLLNGLRDTIFDISKDGMKYHSNNRRWVADPNTVTITVQDARAKSLRITVYGKPEAFGGLKQLLNIQNDMAGYSRFVLLNEQQLPYAVNVIKRSFELKKSRGRIK
ncbi:MAG: hypothetical protein WC877_09010 [Dehalococcoidales bacterium]|jgi:hypothetical protein